MNPSIIFVDFTILLFLFLLYRPTLHGPFTFDDLTILNNLHFLRHIDPLTAKSTSMRIWGIIRAHLRIGWISGPLNLIRIRPITRWSYELNVIMGGLNPFCFHVTNLLIAITSTITFHHILLHFAHPGAALIGALLFAAHPLATMSISYIAGRSSLLAGMFVLLSVLAFLTAHVLFAGVFVVLGILTKEEGIVALPMIAWMWAGGIR